MSHGSVALISMFPFCFWKPRKMDFSKHPIAFHAKISKSATFELRYFGRLCSNFTLKDIIKIFFSCFTLTQYFITVVSPLNKNFALCMLHFCFPWAVYEPIVIVSVQRLLACFVGVLAREFFLLRFVYGHVGKLYVTTTVTNEFST